MAGLSKHNLTTFKWPAGRSGGMSAPLPGQHRNIMKTDLTHSSLEQPTTLFELAARMDVSAPVGPALPAPVVSEKTFATLLQEVESSTPPAATPRRRPAWFNPRLTFPTDTVRAAIFQRTLQRKLEANEVFRPEF